MRQSSLLINIALSIFSVILIYALLEGTFSYIESRKPPNSFWVLSSAETFVFDPVSGFRLTRVPARRARITDGTIEYVGTYFGNNWGFPDQDDFFPQRSGPEVKRYIVLGDSMSHAQYNVHNWPDFVENLASDHGTQVQLLNFSLDGTGLANWWSILKGIVLKDGYDIDGIIFAVYDDNLHRPFTIIDTQDGYRVGRVPFWNPARFPKTREDALLYMGLAPTTHTQIVSEKEFFQALAGEWYPEKIFKLFLYQRILEIIEKVKADSDQISDTYMFDLFLDQPAEEQAYRTMMIKDIQEMVETNNWQAIVIYVPSRSELLARDYDRFYKQDTQAFANTIDASFYDATDAFSMLSDEEIRDHWLPYDGHWNLRGSDRFGRFVVSRIGEQLYASYAQ